MNPWICASLISLAGALGGVVNALMTDNGFVKPMYKHGVLCPGFAANVGLGAAAALLSWALYGSGAGIDLASMSERTVISFRLSALAGAFVVGMAGAKWLTNEVDKKLLIEGVKEAGTKQLTKEDCDKLVEGSPRNILDRVKRTKRADGGDSVRED
jgi:hypothetical protein